MHLRSILLPLAGCLAVGVLLLHGQAFFKFGNGA